MPKEWKKSEPKVEEVKPEVQPNIVPVNPPTEGNVANSPIKIVEGG